jgi:uncharacterized membrane protein YeiH
MQTTLVDSANLFRLVHFFDILAAVVFAVSGALVASRKGMDVMGFMWFAVITGVGGGTVRDLLLNLPVFWVQNPVDVSACLVTAVVMHFVAPCRITLQDALVVRCLRIGAGHRRRHGQASDVGIGVGCHHNGRRHGVRPGIIRDTLGHFGRCSRS